MNAVYLRRIDLARIMGRFYCLDLQPFFFGGVLLRKAMGPHWTHGHMVAESYGNRALAAAAMQRQAERKKRWAIPMSYAA
jgi:predicted DNA-binding WGR domain protein